MRLAQAMGSTQHERQQRAGVANGRLRSFAVPEVLHVDDTFHWPPCPTWEVIRHPAGTTDPNLVQFIKRNSQRKLLCKTALWTGSGWDASRWVPSWPKVPSDILVLVESRLRKRQELQGIRS
jgi:hypothetical protein